MLFRSVPGVARHRTILCVRRGAFAPNLAVGDDVLAVHTHPFNAVHLGDKVYLQLDPKSCNGLPADDKEGVDETMLGD